MSVYLLPDVPLDTTSEVGRPFVEAGVRDYRSAARYVRALPYGRNSDRSDYRLVLSENRGTCSTKHALLAALAREHDAPVELRLGIYLMNDLNTPGVGPVLARHGMEYLPEAHCYLAYRDHRIDVTGPDTDTGSAREFLREETITPDQIGAHKVQAHWGFIQSWAAERGLDADRVWLVREQCIAALSKS